MVRRIWLLAPKNVHSQIKVTSKNNTIYHPNHEGIRVCQITSQVWDICHFLLVSEKPSSTTMKIPPKQLLSRYTSQSLCNKPLNTGHICCMFWWLESVSFSSCLDVSMHPAPTSRPVTFSANVIASIHQSTVALATKGDSLCISRGM